MSYIMRDAVYSLLLVGIVDCTRSDRPPPSGGTSSAGPTATQQPPAALVPSFLGCYELTIQGGLTYHVRLTDTSQAQKWVATSYGPGARNAPGDQWSWMPIDSTRFTLEWGGIDSAMEFTVARGASSYAASGHTQSAGGAAPSDLHPTVRSVACPPPAA